MGRATDPKTKKAASAASSLRWLIPVYSGTHVGWVKLGLVSRRPPVPQGKFASSALFEGWGAGWPGEGDGGVPPLLDARSSDVIVEN
jgi:hypothetical protein